jgi:serine/threonine-protein kinase
LVVLTVSGGAARDTVSVPDVVGLTAGKASGVLRRANLEPTIRLTRSDAAAGTVLSQVPAGGREIDEGGRVRLVVATGPSQRVALTVPDLRGLDVETARRRLGELGLRTTVTRVAAADEEGTILGQSPRAGATLREGQVVRLRVSSGPALVTVPDVVGLDELTSAERLQAAGFQVEVIDQATAEPNEDGIVLSQEPAGSFRAERGAVVTVTVGRLG